MKQCSSPTTNDTLNVNTPDKNVQVKLTTKIIYRDTTIYAIREVPVKGPIQVDTVYLPGTKEVSVIPNIKRTYKDSTQILDSVQVGYTAKVSGTLDYIQLSLKDKRAEKTIVRTIEKTITVQPKGLYLGIGSNVGLTELSPSLMYVNNKNIYGIKYDLASKTNLGIQNLGISYSRRIL